MRLLGPSLSRCTCYQPTLWHKSDPAKGSMCLYFKSEVNPSVKVAASTLATRELEGDERRKLLGSGIPIIAMTYGVLARKAEPDPIWVRDWSHQHWRTA